MDETRWRAIEELFVQVMDCPAHARHACIERLCGTDRWMAQELYCLLAAINSGEDFLEMPIAAPSPECSVNIQPDRIGNYRVSRPIRHGGMGSVYLAHRDDAVYSKQVAIKLIRRGMDNDSILRRFHRERQILASLDHPNIARLLDGGATEEGLPYLVMEYIDGEPLTHWAEKNSLSIPDRLKLFRTVCSAVHYAHQRLVIHLDLKPGNILVTAEGEPKLLDFGIARLLDSGSSREPADTVSLYRPFTPDYASPEQIRGENTTITSDVFSLGVILYQLITSELPRKLSDLTPAQLLERVDSAPHTPRSVLAHGMSPEIGNIVGMAMHADPLRRYASVAELSEDIGRYLLGFPIIARPDTVLYRTRKFLARNRTGVAAAAVIAASLIAGLVTTTWQARVAARQRALAQRNEQQAERRLSNALRLTHSLLFEYHDAIAGLNGSTGVRRTLVEQTLAYLQELERDSGDSPDVQHQLALAYLKVGDVQGRPYAANLGDTAGALSSYRHAVALLAPAAAAHPADPELQGDLASAYDALGRLNTRLLDYPAASADLSWALQVRQSLVLAHPKDEQATRMLASTWQATGDVREYSGNLMGAYLAFQQSEALWRNVSAAHPADLLAQKGWTVSLQRVGAIHESLGDTLADFLHDQVDAQKERTLALDCYQAALATSRTLVALDPANISYLRMEADVGVSAARMLNLLHRSDTAMPLLRTSVAIFSDLSAADPANHESQFDLIDAQCEMASFLAGQGNTAAAVSLFQKSVAHAQRLLRADPDNREWTSYIRTKYSLFEQALLSAGARHQAMSIGEQRLLFDRTWLNLRGQDSVWSNSLANDMLLQAKLLNQSGNRSAAEALARRGLEMERERISEKNVQSWETMSYANALLTCQPAELQNRPEAMNLLLRAAAKGPLSIPAAVDLARIYLLNRQPGRALATLREVASRLPEPLEARDPSALKRDLDSLAAEQP